MTDWRPSEGVALTVADAKEISCQAHICATAGKAMPAVAGDLIGGPRALLLDHSPYVIAALRAARRTCFLDITP